MPTSYLLTGDIGGTNSRMGLYDISSDEPICVKYYRNQDYLQQGSVYELAIIAPFLKMAWETVDNIASIEDSVIVGCLACAGAVRNNSVVMTNIGDQLIDGNAIADNTTDTHLKSVKVCKIINDFVAQGYGCLTLKKEEVEELTPNSWKMMEDYKKSDPGPKVCIGAGTGLGQCFLAPDSAGQYTCYPSEGGHVEFNPRSDIEIKLRKYIMSKFDYKSRISVERVVSGMGLANVYEFLSKEFPDKVDKEIHAEFEAAGDMQAKVVALNAKEGTLFHQAMEIMISAYGSEVGSGALKWIPTGGLYVTGGLTPKNIHFIRGENSWFMKAYKDKGRLSKVLDTVPLFAVMTEDLGVRGAHYCAALENSYLAK
mmetsp:Transcript_15600/g.24263  ORF Transcript_15600/g.24263 Transcript_15600/m.24263 type:complete len:369 (+) Transcript_15600:123-1229(+)|eukprot:CAMPEP_0195304358 /NCGR_PEP_ID=MMETSP0707-20130614/34292_1 /TAXON_ID=33640 /ORGANISM="Asterionellopsis glacialis, Strain CCMP134" /LENGTH=368 /DNA_ID=CAMNT_0040368137 /DNA_START=74 /DNA_END=1180 /DNA_ORIENTATION=-